MLEQNLKTRSAVAALCLALGLMFVSSGQAPAAEDWNFYMHQSAPNFATSRGAKARSSSNAAPKRRLPSLTEFNAPPRLRRLPVDFPWR